MFLSLISKAWIALSELRANFISETKTVKHKVDLEIYKIDVLVEWSYHCVINKFKEGSWMTLNEIFEHIKFIKNIVKQIYDAKNKGKQEKKEKIIKSLNITAAYWAILILNWCEKDDKDTINLAIPYINKCSLKRYRSDAFSKIISKICSKIKSKNTIKIYESLQLKPDQLKELQEYKKLCEPSRIGPMTDLPKITEYFMTKMHDKSSMSSK